MTNIEFVNFCKEATKLKTLYMWGTYGKKITESLISSKKEQYPYRYSEAREAFLKKHIDGETIGCDCAGLIKWALWTNGDISLSPKYSAATDRGTGGLYSAAKEKGIIKTLPELEGVLVWKNGHVGVYIGNGDVIECTLGDRGDGVVKTKLSAADWTHWLKLPELEYVQPVKKPEEKPIEPLEKVHETEPEKITPTVPTIITPTITANQKKISLLKKLKKILLK